MVWTFCSSSNRGRNNRSFPLNSLLVVVSYSLSAPNLFILVLHCTFDRRCFKAVIILTETTDSVPVSSFWLHFDLKIKIELSPSSSLSVFCWICCESKFLYCPLKMAVMLWRRQTMDAIWSALSEQSWAYLHELNKTDWGKLSLVFSCVFIKKLSQAWTCLSWKVFPWGVQGCPPSISLCLLSE